MLHESLEKDVSSIVTDYLTLEEMRALGIKITSAILRRIVGPMPLTLEDYRNLVPNEVNTIEADILLNGVPPEFLTDVTLYALFPQSINDLIVKTAISTYTPEIIYQLSQVISRNPPGQYRQPRGNTLYPPGHGIDTTFGPTTVHHIVEYYLQHNLVIPEVMLSFLIETGNFDLIQKIMLRSDDLLDVRYVSLALHSQQIEIMDYILAKLFNRERTNHTYNLLRQIEAYLEGRPYLQLIKVFASNSYFLDHAREYITSVDPTENNRFILETLLNNPQIRKRTSKQFWQDISDKISNRMLQYTINTFIRSPYF